MISNYGRKFAFILFTLILIGLSVAAVVLKTSSITFMKEESGTSFFSDNVTSNQMHQIWVLPENLYRTPTKFVIGTAITSIVISALTLAYMAMHIRDAIASLPPPTALVAFVALLLNAILALAAMIALQTTHEFSAQLMTDHNSTLPAGVYDSSTFDLETWACEVKNVKDVSRFMHDSLSNQCRVERAGRLVVVFWMLTPVVVAGMAGWMLWGVKKGLGGKDAGQGNKRGWKEWIPLNWWKSGRVRHMPAPVPLERRPYSSQYSAANRSAA
ncbi:uncharacterized protein BDZ99DRAFT_571241 [Mytilinidion resinicola]|uniref:Uncharacterized protein n=1 Tax=Mytilinidion resinicola TaxID=574789 RepID=A0A6A6YN34_9PEZI|nr:uncharacterized protein BDZ99DRAFT_571241 [Mytilinidion resinicola]KAF2809414.1 hypothetical protein BDZ99DRAFT_571241 [Mytilinidion resinicola]